MSSGRVRERLKEEIRRRQEAVDIRKPDKVFTNGTHTLAIEASPDFGCDRLKKIEITLPSYCHGWSLMSSPPQPKEWIGVATTDCLIGFGISGTADLLIESEEKMPSKEDIDCFKDSINLQCDQNVVRCDAKAMAFITSSIISAGFFWLACSLCRKPPRRDPMPDPMPGVRDVRRR